MRPPIAARVLIEEDDRTGLRITTELDASGRVICRHVERMPTDQELRERIAHLDAVIERLKPMDP